MGYYSEVGLTISAAGYKQLTGKLTTLEDSELRTVVENLLAHADTHYTSKEGDQLWFWNWTKWYSTFPEINWLQAQLNELDAQDFYFIRIGAIQNAMIAALKKSLKRPPTIGMTK